MRLPAPLLRHNKRAYKNNFGHVLILAGSRSMLGAAALTSLSALRSGAGLVTLGIPQSLNKAAQRKVNNEIMTLPLPETKEGSLSLKAYATVLQFIHRADVIALGPGLSQEAGTTKLIRKVIHHAPVPLVIDADALNALTEHLDNLQSPVEKVLTPHPGEMARLIKKTVGYIETHRKEVAVSFAAQHKCTLVLKGHKTVVASKTKQSYINTTGNAGMATAGSGDVLTGMIAAFLAQGLSPFDAAKYAVYLHGKAGDLAAKQKTRLAMIASDIIACIPKAVKTSTR